MTTNAVGPAPVVVVLDAIFFRNDHCKPGLPDEKLIRPSPGNFADANATTFSKPEWTAGGGATAPVSYTMGTNVVVDLRVQFTMTPAARKAKLTRIRGASSEGAFNYERTIDPPEEISQGERYVWWMVPQAPLVAMVEELHPKIEWFATIDGVELSIGESGPHTVYVTFGRPHGQMEGPPTDFPRTTGREQSVTEERLKLAVSFAFARFGGSEKEIVDRIFKRLSVFQSYALGFTWPSAARTETFHEYLWHLLDGTNRGECHMLAAAFVLACQIVGVGAMELGRMYPSGRRDPKSGLPRPNPKRGFYERLETRTHTISHLLGDEHHGREMLGFQDSKGGNNNFEAVAKYDRFLYGIGEEVPQSGATVDDDVHLWYERCNFSLHFLRRDTSDYCANAYDGYVQKSLFLWTD